MRVDRRTPLILGILVVLAFLALAPTAVVAREVFKPMKGVFYGTYEEDPPSIPRFLNLSSLRR